MRRKKILTEAQLIRIVKNSVKKILKESVEIKEDDRIVIEDKIENAKELCRDIQRLYFQNERLFDRFPRFDSAGLDGAGAWLDDLSMSLDYPEEIDFEAELKSDIAWQFCISWKIECEGYGPGAMSRGFSGSHPISVLWVKNRQIIRLLNSIAEIVGIDITGARNAGIEWSRTGKYVKY